MPESRKEEGLFMELTLAANTTFVDMSSVSARGFLRPAAERTKRPWTLLHSLSVYPPAPSARVSSRPGGNQQKVLFARWLFKQPRVLILDEPTRGVDVGARAAIDRLIHDLAEQGAAILMISSELEEVLGLAHRVLVIRRGTITHEFAADPPLGDVMEAGVRPHGEAPHDRPTATGRSRAVEQVRRPTSIAARRARPWRGHRIRAEHVRDYGIIVVFHRDVRVLPDVQESDVFLTKRQPPQPPLLPIPARRASAACAVTLVVIGGNFDLSLGGIYIPECAQPPTRRCTGISGSRFPSGSRPASRWG